VSAGRVLWGAIVAFVLALAACAVVVVVRANTGSARAAPSGAAVDAKGIAFVPASLTVKTGTEVTFTNRDAVPHTITADDGSIDSGILQPGKSFKVKASKPFAYHCNIHPSMKAKIELSG
jgi:plastocyanin